MGYLYFAVNFDRRNIFSVKTGSVQYFAGLPEPVGYRSLTVYVFVHTDGTQSIGNLLLVQRLHVLYGVFCSEPVPFWGGDSTPFKATGVLCTYIGNLGSFFGGWKLCFSSSDPAVVAMSYGDFVLAK